MTPPSGDGAVAVAAARAGAEVVRRLYGTDVAHFAKAGFDFATEADVEAEAAIRNVILQARPDDAFEGEEGGLEGAVDAQRTWLVDPLCGTLNFAARTPLVCVNVALREDRELGAAAVADPIAHELWWTEGHGAYGADDHQPLVPSAVSRLVDIDFVDPAWAAALASNARFQSSFGIRVSSTSLALAWVATGRRAAYVQGGDVRGSVHFAAGIALCQAAGCVVTGLDGEPVWSAANGLLASADTETHEALLEILPRR